MRDEKTNDTLRERPVQPEVRTANAIINCKASWKETTTRKNKLKICSDMFIAKTLERYIFVIVKNGKLVFQKNLTDMQAHKMVEYYDLEYMPSDLFTNNGSYRTSQSNNLIMWFVKKCA